MKSFLLCYLGCSVSESMIGPEIEDFVRLTQCLRHTSTRHRSSRCFTINPEQSSRQSRRTSTRRSKARTSLALSLIVDCCAAAVIIRNQHLATLTITSHATLGKHNNTIQNASQHGKPWDCCRQRV